MGSSQKQNAGAGSSLVQAETINILGIDEKRAREIYEEKYEIAKLQFTKEAIEIAESRILEFEKRLLNKMKTSNNGISSFADPSMQMLIVEAQKVAAQTDRVEDFDILTELLSHRVQNSGRRETISGINRAVKIVNEISDEALQGLTLIHSISSLYPVAGNISAGISVFDSLYTNLLYSKLPEGDSWIDHLDVLGSIRILPFAGGFNPLKVVFKELLSGYFDCGLKCGSKELILAAEIIEENGIHPSILVEHELHGDHMRIPVVNKNGIKELRFNYRTTSGVITQPLEERQVVALERIYDLYVNDESAKNAIIDGFFERWNKCPTLNAISNWWHGISISFQITAVGKVLAHANAQRCENRIPSM